MIERLAAALLFSVLQATALPAHAAPEVPDQGEVLKQAEASTQAEVPNRVEAPNRHGHPAPAVLGGDWFGLRSALKKHGVTAEIGLIAEGAHSLGGGRQRGTAGAYELNLGVDADLATLAGWNGAKFHLLVIHREGSDLSAKIGNIFAVQETYSRHESVGLVTLALEQSFFEHRLNVMFGRIQETADFANSQYFCRFQTLSICGVPFLFPYDGAMTYYPASSWGIRLRGLIGDNRQLKTGVYQVNPELAAHNGFQFFESGTTGVSIPVELSYHSAKGDIYKLGAIYETSRLPELAYGGGSSAGSSGAPREHKGRASAYVAAEQVLAGSSRPGSRSVVLLAGADAIDRRTAFFQDFEYVGIVFNGPLASRPQDAVSVLVTRGGVSRDLVNSQRRARAAGATTAPQDYEGVLEVDYRIGLKPGLTITPNLQHIFHPGGSDALRNATVFGVKLEVAI